MTYDDLIRITVHEKLMDHEFLISMCPVTVAEFRIHNGLGKPEPGENGVIKQATWQEAIRYCNLLCREEGRPPSYDEESGVLMTADGNVAGDVSQVKGFRLPTFDEWFYAATGLSDIKTSNYRELLEKTFLISGMSYSPGNDVGYISEHGWQEIDRLEVNNLGIYGMLGNSHEWYSDCIARDGIRNKVCFWDWYYANYDNAIAFTEAKRKCSDGDRFAFRMVKGVP